MKSYKFLISLFVTIIFTTACEDFLDRSPLDQVASSDYWRTPKDLQLYMNNFYSIWGGDTRTDALYLDAYSDNNIQETFYSLLAGTRVVPASGGNYSFSRIRNVNYFIEHYQTVDLPWEQIRHYVGEAYFYRAYFYFNLVYYFGDVPFIDKLLDDESEELYAPRSSRNVIIDFIISDLDMAISALFSKGDAPNMRLTKEVALLFKSRVCLFEGTWEKYHSGTPFGVSGSEGIDYLRLASNAAKQIIDGGLHNIYVGGNPEQDYYRLFGQIDYSTNPEVMFWKKWDMSLGQVRWQPSVWGHGFGLTKGLIDSYLCKDGLPTAKSPLYVGDNNLVEVVTNRDPRLEQTIYLPWDPVSVIDGDTAFFEKADIDLSGSYLCTTGYQLKKHSNRWGEHLSENHYQCETGSIFFRYAEVLLNYAEAKAELGEINQIDLDISINKLRDRVDMPHLKLDNIAIDPNWDFPTLTPIINEIRRERRVELAIEGLRLMDLLRWRAHDIFKDKRSLGAKFVQSDYPTMKPGSNIYLDNEGYIDIHQKSLPNGYGFKPERDYLYPIPSVELTLNSNLKQNPGW